MFSMFQILEKNRYFEIFRNFQTKKSQVSGDLDQKGKKKKMLTTYFLFQHLPNSIYLMILNWVKLEHALIFIKCNARAVLYFFTAKLQLEIEWFYLHEIH